MKISLGHSPDPDDAFMFYAMARGLVDTSPYQFEHILQDIQTLNERAGRGELDVTAVSIHAWAHLTESYALMPCGASMGDNYGPMLVSLRPLVPACELPNLRIAVPGKLTSAFLTLQLFLGRKDAEIDTVVVPFDEIFEAVRTGRADVGLIIHEGQLTYAREGFHLVEDLGQWWFRETKGLPLPLGGNVVRKSLGAEHVRAVTRITRDSIRYGLEHRAAAVKHSLPLGRGLDEAEADRFIGMYVNELTLDYGERGRAGIREFLRRAHQQGLIPEPVALEFVEI
ncbi:MAG: MqnA/MqnD/SBP family protein [Candidatus Methylacidiphilales bacterium]|nr:MqnA/MqnD/SBP family protein [Candidatus Methylacidiphilales bacterium]